MTRYHKHALVLAPADPLNPKFIGECAGCLGEMYDDEQPVVSDGMSFCGTYCMEKGRHWIDPWLCGGCKGTHEGGVRP